MQQHTSVRGLVIRETDFGDNDRYITVLTEPGAKLEVLCRGIRRKGSRLLGAVRLFCYAELQLYESRGRFSLNDAELVISFWGVTQDIERYALACYFAELCALLCETDELCPDITKLILFALRAIEGGKRPLPLVKAAFELRALAESGFAPQLRVCGACTKALAEQALFSVREGTAVCADCARRLGGDWLPLLPSVLQAMRHIMSCELPRVFSFAVGEDSQRQLAEVCEKYTLYHMDKGFDSLKFYHSLFTPMVPPRRRRREDGDGKDE